METALIGFLAGAFSGAFMGLVSHTCFRLGLFKSSLIVIDGSFFFRTLRLQGSPSLTLGTGFVIHLVTSGIFGALYVAATGYFEFTTLSFPLVSIYVLLLWLSMLFIALPAAGEGMLGNKSGHFAWLEQFILHMIFLVLYFIVLKKLS